MRIPVVGGPADGARIALPGGVLVRYIDGERGRGFRADGPGRTLYVLDRIDRCWRFSPGVRPCGGCGALVLVPVDCPVCGAAAPARRVSQPEYGRR